jgi:hypothetical protein
MGSRWSVEQVLALAPDAASATAGRKLARPAPWSGTGAADAPAAVWGECAGSGAKPYRAAVDLAGPAFSCTCPSRKFPCKHALGLLLLWSSGGVPTAEAPDWVGSWLQARADRTAKSARAAATTPVTDPEAARRRSQRRDERMTDGLAELSQWLHDQVRTGLAGTERAGYGPFDALAARMVDAQLPGVASRIRRLPGVAASGAGWHERLLAEYGLLHLLARAGTAVLQGTTPDGLDADIVRTHLGVPVPSADVLAAPPVRDAWAVLAQQDVAEERLVVRRSWLLGDRTGRAALVLSFAPAGGSLDATLLPGSTLDADVHFHPGRPPLRALVGQRHGEPLAGVTATGIGVQEALARWAGALALDPWLSSWPVLLAGVVPVHGEHGWQLVEAATGASLPVHGVDDGGWAMLAVSGGRPVQVLAEVSDRGARPVAVLPVPPQAEEPALPVRSRPVVL